MSTQKFNEAKERLIISAERMAGSYLLNKYGSAHLVNEPKVELTSTIDPNSSEIRFDGRITVYAADTLINPIVGVNMTVNSNDIEIESEDVQDKVENTLNSQQELEPVKASLSGFKLIDDSSKYYKVAHSDLQDATLGIVGKSEYANSPDRSELLQTIVKDAMSRVANETTINFEGSFVEPIIEKVALEKMPRAPKKCEVCEDIRSEEDPGGEYDPTCVGYFCPKHEEVYLNKKQSAKKSWLTADFMGEESMPEIPVDYPVQPLKPGQEAKDPVTCGTCGRSWDDAVITEMTPAPSARCPFEAFHDYEDTTDVDAATPFGIKEDMPKASSADHLAQASQLEEQLVNASTEKIKTQAVNALVSMLQSQGFGSAKVREVTASNTGFDVMVTVDADATLKAVNLPVEVKENNVILPKKSLVAALVASGLDLNARLSEEFSKTVLARIEAEEARIQYEQNETQSILNERPTVTKTAGDNGFNSPQFMDGQDSITLQKHLLPAGEWKKGDVVYADNQYWKLSDTNFDQNSKGEDEASQYHFVKCDAPKSDDKVTNIKV